MPHVENPKGLTFADFIAAAESCEAKAKVCRDHAGRRDDEGHGDDEMTQWLLDLAAQHDQEAQHFRSLAKAMGDTDPLPPETL